MQKILIIAPSWVGDLIMSQTLFKELRNAHKNSLILHVFANGWAYDLLLRMKEVDKVIINPFNHGEFKLMQRIKLAISLKKNDYDQAIILPNSFKSAIIPFFARISKRTGFVGEFRYGLINDIYKLDKDKLPLMIDRFVYLSGKTDKTQVIPNLTVDNIKQADLVKKFKLKLPFVAFCPGAEYGAAKRWSEANFASVAKLLILEGYQIVIFGSKKDEIISNNIIELAQNTDYITNLCGQTTLTDVVDILSLSTAVITNDSGLMHIACSVSCNVIAIYGSTSPSFTPPLNNKAQIIKKELSCSPCFSRVCRFRHYNCLNFITPLDVLQKIKNII